MIKINNKEYAWGDIKVVVLGRQVIGIIGIEYTAKKAKEARFGAGREPKSIQHGRREYEGTLTLMQSEVIALNRAAQAGGYRDILDVDVDIVVSYLGDNGIVSTDAITCASFSELPKGMKEGDLQSEHALAFIALDIESDIV
jgi:hypothetical protein